MGGVAKTKHLDIDGVRYEITARHYDQEMYRATWTCMACREEGAWAPVSREVTQAVQSAAVGIRLHHSFCHGPGTTPRKLR